MSFMQLNHLVCVQTVQCRGEVCGLQFKVETMGTDDPNLYFSIVSNIHSYCIDQSFLLYAISTLCMQFHKLSFVIFDFLKMSTFVFTHKQIVTVVH